MLNFFLLILTFLRAHSQKLKLIMQTKTTKISTGKLTQAMVDRFKIDGFLLVEDFFSHEELDRFGSEVDKAVRYRTVDDNRSHGDKNLYEQTFVQCMGLWEDNVPLRPLTFHQKLCATAADLLETDCVRLWQDQALYKEAGGRKTDAHLDYPFWPVDKPRLVSAWIPFDGCKLGGGAMGYVQGSHKLGICRFVDIGHLKDEEPYDILKDTQVSSRPLVWIEAPKGSVIFHHALTVHTADANRTNKTRRVFTTVYMADGCRRTRDDFSVYLDRDGIKKGDLIAGPGLPVAWPRDEKQLPKPPSVLGPKTGFGLAD